MDLIKEILSLEVPDQLTLSPDGKQVAYFGREKWDHKPKDAHHSRVIWVADTTSAQSARRLTEGDFNDRAPQWAPDGSAVAFLSDRGERGKSCAVYLAAPSGDGEPRAVTPAASGQQIAKFRFSHDGRHVFFAATPEKSADARAREERGDDVQVWGEGWEFAHLYRAEVESGQVEALFDEDVHVVDFSLNDEGDGVALVTGKTPHIESDFLHGCEIRTFKFEEGRLREEQSVHIPREPYDLTWCGSSLYFITWNVPENSSTGLAVYSIDLSANKSGELHYSRIAYGDENCAIPGLRKAGDKLLVYVHHGMEDQIRLLDGTILFTQKKKILDYDAVVPQDSSGDITMVLATGDINTPTEVFTVDTTTSSLTTQLSSHGSSFTARHRLAHTLIFLSCPSLDGSETISGFYLRPAGAAAPLPTYVSIHGGPYGRITDTFDTLDPVLVYAQHLLAAGIGVLVPDYRGSSGRGQRYATVRYGADDEPDVAAVTQRAVALGLADAARLAVGGWSQGGYLSYLSAVRNGGHGGLGWRFRCAVAGAGVTEWDGMALTSDVGYAQAEGSGCLWRLDKDDVSTRGGSALWEFRKAVEEGRIPPLLMVHGEKDARVPITQAWGFRRAMEEAGLSFQFITYPREGHFIQETLHLEDLIQRVVGFVKEHLLSEELV